MEMSDQQKETPLRHQLFHSPSTLISSIEIQLPLHSAGSIDSVTSPHILDTSTSTGITPGRTKRKRVLKSHVEAIKDAIIQELKVTYETNTANNAYFTGLTVQELLNTVSVSNAAMDAYGLSMKSKAQTVIKNFVQNKLDGRIEASESPETSNTRYSYNPHGKLNVQEIRQGHTLVEVQEVSTGKVCVVKGSEVAYSLAEEIVKRNAPIASKIPKKKSIISSVHAALRCNSGGSNKAYGFIWTLPEEATEHLTISSLSEAITLFFNNHPVSDDIDCLVVSRGTNEEGKNVESKGNVTVQVDTDVDTEVDTEDEVDRVDTEVDTEVETEVEDDDVIDEDTPVMSPARLFPSSRDVQQKGPPESDDDRTESEDEGIRPIKHQKPQLALPNDNKSSSESSDSEEEEIDPMLGGDSLLKGTWSL